MYEYPIVLVPTHALTLTPGKGRPASVITPETVTPPDGIVGPVFEVIAEPVALGGVEGAVVFPPAHAANSETRLVPTASRMITCIYDTSQD